MDSVEDLLVLSLLPGIGSRTVRDLSGRGPLRDVLARPEEHADRLTVEARSLLGSGRARREAEVEAQRATRLGIRIVGRDDETYPPLLRQIYDPPAVLYIRGTLVAGEGPQSVAIVGSRACSPPGRALARAIARDLAASGATVISGLARGIDTSAHRGALDAHGRTVAVLGCGLDRTYPLENAELAAAIADTGAVVSEFPLGTPPRPENFPRRNRVIAGCSRAVVIVEATDRSGALVTARVALDEGREVLAVPGHPTHPGAAGTNRLIRDGAALVRDAADVAQEMGFAMAAIPAVEAGVDDVLAALPRDAPASLEEIRERSGRSIPELLTRLTELEVANKVRRLPGTLFIRH